MKRIQYPISCSYAISSEIKKMYKFETLVVQNGVDDVYFNQVSNEEKKKLREKLGIKFDKKIFLYVGSLDRRKDPLTLISAFKQADINGAELLIIGEGPLSDECNSIANESIKILGHKSNVKEYLQSSDVFISASTSEGLPMAVLEAMSTGKPLILSDIGPHLELIDNEHKNGELFQVGNINHLREVLIKFNNISLDEMSTNSRKLVNENLNSNSMSMKYQKFYDEMLSNKF
jgi:glycosyltransferase involved in cell wall biosynthesis